MNKNVVYAALLLGLGGYYAYTTYLPVYEKWQIEIDELQKNIAQAQATAPKVALLKKQENELKEKLKASLTKLPSGGELSNLLNLVMPILKDVGIASTRLATKSVDPPVLHDVYRIHGIAVGGIKDVPIETIVNLLFKLRNFSRIVNVKTISMIRTAPNKPTYTIDLHLETYSYIEMEGDELGTEASSADTADITTVEPAPAESTDSPAMNAKQDTAPSAETAPAKNPKQDSTAASPVSAGDSASENQTVSTETAASTKVGR